MASDSAYGRAADRRTRTRGMYSLYPRRRVSRRGQVGAPDTGFAGDRARAYGDAGIPIPTPPGGSSANSAAFPLLGGFLRGEMGGGRGSGA